MMDKIRHSIGYPLGIRGIENGLDRVLQIQEIDLSVLSVILEDIQK